MSGTLLISWTPEHRLRTSQLLDQDLSYKEVAERLAQEFNLPFTGERVRWQYRSGQLNQLDDKPIVSTKKQFEFHDEGNTATATLKSTDNPKTLEELIAVGEIDLDIWVVDHYIQNKWGGAMKINDEVVHYPLFQVKAWLIRKIPIRQEFPTLQPIIAPNFKRIPLKPSIPTTFYRALTIPDSQIGFYRNLDSGHLEPFHDRRALSLALQAAQTIKYDVIVFLGDMLDLAEWSDKFVRSPEVYFTTQPAINELHWWLQQFALTGAKLIYFEGNHEMRLPRLMKKNLVAGYGIHPANEPDSPKFMSIPSWLGLEKLGVEYKGPYPMAEYWFNDNLRGSHGNLVRAKSGDSVRAIVENARNSEICGHVHRHEMASKTVHPMSGPITYVAFSPGTTARLETGVVPSGGPRMNWQQGLGDLLYELNNGLFQITPLSINNGNMLFHGQHMVYNKNISEIVSEAVNLR